MKRIIFVVLAAIGLAVGAAAPSQAAKPAPTVNEPYYGHWSAQAVVYDATGGNNRFKVSEAVTEWSRSGWNVVMTSDPARANIMVLAEDSSIFGAVGDASPSSSNNVITSCTVHLSPAFANVSGGEQLAIHELGHCGGLPHSTSSRSAMYPYTSSSSKMTAPSKTDLQWMGKNY